MKDRIVKGDDEGRDSATSLADKRVLIVGIGGLGTPAAWALAGAGVGSLVLMDPDVVETSNLHRQILHRTTRLGMAKAASARIALASAFPRVRIEAIREPLTPANVATRFARVHFVIDGTDEVEAKYLINDAAIRRGVPYSHAGVSGLQGQTFTVLPGRSPCLRCVFPEAPSRSEGARCRDEGILGPVAGVIGFLQAAEALRCLRGRQPAFAGRLLTFDARALRWRAVPLPRSAACSLCHVHQPIAPHDEAAISPGS